MAKLEPGDKAPAFLLPDQDGKKVGLKDLKGKPAVVYFYPSKGSRNQPRVFSSTVL